MFKSPSHLVNLESVRIEAWEDRGQLSTRGVNEVKQDGFLASDFLPPGTV